MDDEYLNRYRREAGLAFRREHDLYIKIISGPVNGWGGHSDPRNPKWDIFHYRGYLRNRYGKERSDAFIDAALTTIASQSSSKKED